jgi:putative phosphoesterase
VDRALPSGGRSRGFESLLARLQLAIISDTHMPRGPRALPAACVARLRAADAILHAGDLVALEVLELLQSLGPPVHAVHGNVDDPAVRMRLPAVRIVEAGGARIVMTHDGGPAEGRLARLRSRFPDADAVVFGHSHLPLHDQAGGFQIFNPGSPTERRRAPAHTMGLATAHDGRLEFELVELGSL